MAAVRSVAGGTQAGSAASPLAVLVQQAQHLADVGDIDLLVQAERHMLIARHRNRWEVRRR